MDHKTVERLESELEHAIAEIFARLDVKKVPLDPSPRIMHLMAKAATTVYEAAVENSR